MKCEYPQKLSTDVDKPVDNLWVVGQAHEKQKTEMRRTLKKNEQVFAVSEAFVYTVIKTNECLQ